jgi:hypothetical protein
MFYAFQIVSTVISTLVAPKSLVATVFAAWDGLLWWSQLFCRETLLAGGAPGVLSSQLSRSVTDSAVCLHRPAGCHLQISDSPQAAEFKFVLI